MNNQKFNQINANSIIQIKSKKKKKRKKKKKKVLDAEETCTK